MQANELRRAFTSFFVDRGHTAVPSSGLIPHHPRAPLFTNAGMNQFLPYFLGEEAPPYPRATSVQKCVRIRGKHDDIDLIGRTPHHFSFFEMLGNFSFGDYFKEQAIPLAWELLTSVFGLDGDRLWATVHTTDDEAERIWRDVVGLPAERIQRMGEDNFWEMGETGPCGPSSEIYFDKGDAYGDGGGPAGGNEARYIEIWNLVFMQYDRQPDGSLQDLPRRNIDTGAGLERVLSVIQGVDSVWEVDNIRALIALTEKATGRRYGDDAEVDVALRMLADHGRSMTFLVNDGVFPSNEDRGYVLRRIIRRAVRQAFLLGVEKPIVPELVSATVEVMGEAYPELVKNADFVSGVVTREEERFRRTLRAGLTRLEEELEAGEVVHGDVAFQLHDTYGFPIELTREIAGERGARVDDAGFEAAMEEQRRRAREAIKGAANERHIDAYRELVDEFGATEFTGYAEYESKARVLAVLDNDDGTVEVFLDRTPFYAEGGGQVGDTGQIFSETGKVRVVDTTYALPGLHRHRAEVVEGTIEPGQEVTAAIDGDRRDAIRRNHTGTHLLHWALREVYGQQVKQQGSYVGPDRLRFDFNNDRPMTPEEIDRVERLVNERILANEPVRAYETSMEQAEEIGAISFFGEKYGDVVRVLEAGSRSVELCGGTHVPALGTIGPFKIVSEGSIGSGLRRIEAFTGEATLERLKEDEEVLERAAELLKSKPTEVPDAVERMLARQKSLEDELRALRSKLARGEARELAGSHEDGVVIARRDGLSADELRELSQAVRQEPEVRAVVLIGSPDGERVALVAAVEKGTGFSAPELVKDAAKAVGGGGGGKNAEFAQAGGRDASKIDEALDTVRAAIAARR